MFIESLFAAFLFVEFLLTAFLETVFDSEKRAFPNSHFLARPADIQMYFVFFRKRQTPTGPLQGVSGEAQLRLKRLAAALRGAGGIMLPG